MPLTPKDPVLSNGDHDKVFIQTAPTTQTVFLTVHDYEGVASYALTSEERLTLIDALVAAGQMAA